MPTRKVLKQGRAPVIYTLAQVQFAPVLKMGQHMADIQEQLSPNLPMLEEKQEIGFRFAMAQDGITPQPQPSPTTIWQFMSMDRRTALSLRQNSFVFHSTEYTEYDDFEARMSAALSVVNGIVPIGVAVRYGLRYVDVLPSDAGGQPSRHIIPSMSGLSGEAIASVTGLPGIEALGANLQQRMNESVFQTVFGTLMVRMIETEGAPALAPDLIATNISIPNLPKPATGERFISLDIDHFQDSISEVFSVERTREVIRNLHVGTSAAFFAILRDDSISEWARAS